MKVYINNTLIDSEVLPSNTPTFDETLETFSFALISNNDPMPYAPMQEVKLDIFGDNTEVIRFVLTSDSVDVFSTNPLRYKHNIVCIQYDRKLSKELVRNTVITQPANPKKESYNSAYFAMHFYSQPNPDLLPTRYEPIGYNDTFATLNAVSKPLSLSAREKAKSIKIKIELKVCNALLEEEATYWKNFLWDENVKTQADFKVPVYPSNVYVTFFDHLVCRFKNGGGYTETRNIYPSDLGLSNFVFNQEMDFSGLFNLINEGARDFELLFDGTPIQIYNASEFSVPDLEMVLGYFMTIKIIAETYYYSAYDVLNILLNRQKKQTLLKSSPALFSLPVSGDLYNLLNNTIAPNFTFTQSTMYECVADVFRLFDAIFRINNNNVLDIEYFNDLDKEEIQDTIFTGRNISSSEDKYTNGLVSYYQDARVDDVFPTQDSFAHLRSPEFGVAQAYDNSAIVNFPIDSLDSFKVKVPVPVIYGSAIAIGFPRYELPTNLLTVELIDRIVEQSIWSNLPTLELPDGTSYDNFNLTQITSFFFTKGDNKINISYSAKEHVWFVTTTVFSFTKAIITQLSLMSCIRYYRKNQLLDNSYYSVGTTPDWKNVMFQVAYKASVSGVTKVESVVNKYNGSLLADQYNGAVDLNKMGLNMLGLSLKLGNPVMNATHRISSWANRVKVGQIYFYQNKLWIANVANYTFMKGAIQGKISFVQNFNQLSLRTQILREKRMSNISQELISKSEEIITDYVYYTSGVAPREILGDTIHFSASYLSSFITTSFKLALGVESDSIKEAVVNYVESGGNATGIFIPMVKYGAGNTINFEMSFNQPVSAGNKTNAISGAWFGSSNYFTSSVNYSDSEGFMDETTIRCFPVSALDKDRNFPEMAYALPTDHIFRIPNYKVYKQPNEIFALNYQLAFLPYPNRENIDFIGTKFINNNAFVKKLKGLKNCYVYFFSKERKFSQIDTKLSIDASYVTSRLISTIIGSTTSYKALLFDFVFSSNISSSNVTSTKSWCVIDEENDILFASNSTISDTSKVTISFTPRLNRI